MKSIVPINITAVEQQYNATYVCDLCIRIGNTWDNQPAAIFWQETPPIEGYSNYFAMRVHNGHAYISSGEFVNDLKITAIQVGDQIIYSRYRHDMRWDSEKICAIDGGRDYTKVVGTPDRYLTLQIIGPNLVEVNDSNQGE